MDCKQKTPTQRRQGVTVTDYPWGRAAKKQPTIRPTEYRCYIKEDVQYATAGAVTPSWNTFLRPPGKLPVPVALNARSPTLFGLTIHHFPGNVKRVFGIILRKLWGELQRGYRYGACSARVPQNDTERRRAETITQIKCTTSLRCCRRYRAGQA